MTVQSTNNRTDAVADGVQTVFPYDYLLLKEEHLRVILDGVIQLADWVVDGVGNPTGGNVTFTTPPLATVQVTLLRDVPLTQEIEYTEYDPFPAKVAETGLDLAVMRDQQAQEERDRSLHYNPVDAPDSGTELPTPSPNTAIGYDGVGNLTNVVVGVGGGPVVNPLLSDLRSGGFDFVATDGPGGAETAKIEGATGVITAAVVDGAVVAQGGVPLDLLYADLGDFDAHAAGVEAHGLAKNNLTSAFDPAPADDDTQGYSRNSVWINTLTDTVFTCADPVTGAAVWTKGGGGAAYIHTDVTPADPEGTPSWWDTEDGEAFQYYDNAGNPVYVQEDPGAGSGGGMVPIESGVLTNQPQLIVPLDNTLYSSFQCRITGLRSITNSVAFILRTSVDGGLTFEQAANDYQWVRGGAVPTQVIFAGADLDTHIELASLVSNIAAWSGSIILDVDASGATEYTQFSASVNYRSVTPDAVVYAATGQRFAITSPNALGFFMSSGNFDLRYELFGRRGA